VTKFYGRPLSKAQSILQFTLSNHRLHGHRRRPHGARGARAPPTLRNCWAQGGTVGRRMASDQRLFGSFF